MARTVLQDVDRVLASFAYKAWAKLHSIDANKVKLERQGNRRPLSQDSYGRVLIEAIRVGLATQSPPPPDPPPPPPPPAYKKVAPKVANKEGTSDARFCLLNQPGVVWSPSHPLGPCYVDEVARYDTNGLHLGGRSDACTQSWTDGLVGAKQMDAREPCDLPRVGDPTKNTGSWTV